MVSNAFGNWFAGFVAGEGCFCIYVPSRKKVAAPINVLFSIHLRLDDIAILTEIKEQLQCGHIIIKPQWRYSKPSAVFAVSNADDLKHKIIPLFEKFPLRAKKQRDFSIWSKAVGIYWSMCHGTYSRTKDGGNSRWTKENRHEMLALSELLKKTREFCVPTDLLPKYEPLGEKDISFVKERLAASDIEMIDAKEAAKLWNIGRQGIERARRDNRIISAKVGKRRHKYPRWQFETSAPKRLSEIIRHLGIKNTD